MKHLCHTLTHTHTPHTHTHTHYTQVKDRFNSLLCQKVAEFEDRVKQLQSDAQPDGNESSVSAESGGGGHVMQDVSVGVCVGVCVCMCVWVWVGGYR